MLQSSIGIVPVKELLLKCLLNVMSNFDKFITVKGVMSILQFLEGLYQIANFYIKIYDL